MAPPGPRPKGPNDGVVFLCVAVQRVTNSPKIVPLKSYKISTDDHFAADSPAKNTIEAWEFPRIFPDPWPSPNISQIRG